MDGRPIDAVLARERLVWMFLPERGGSFPCGAWTDRSAAEAWIERVSATGVLSAYALGESAYAAHVRLGLFKLATSKGTDTEFERVFSTALDHAHYEKGKPLPPGGEWEGRNREWPTNAHGHKACPCCGYHTLGPVGASYDICPVCHWEEDVEGRDIWDTSHWGMANQMTVEQGRVNFERLGAKRDDLVKHCRRPLQEELPRHDWKTDPRPHAG